MCCQNTTSHSADEDALRIHAKSLRYKYVDEITDIKRLQKFEIACQYNKYQPVTDILNSLGLGVKVSFRMVDSFAVSKPSNSISSHHSAEANSCLSNTVLLSSTKK